jgi:YidC/Oxa1 family membrane protein insertase
MSGNKQASADNQNASTMQMMNYIFPFMTVFFAFSLPAGLGLYWIISNIVQFVQQIVLTKYFAKTLPDGETKKEHFRERENRRKKK